jgi:hypothetical protein
VKAGKAKRKRAMLRNFKVMLVVLVVLVLAGGAYAFAAANDVAPSAAGYSDNTVSGYLVGSIVYDLNKDDPTQIDNIKFTVTPIDSAAPLVSLVKIQTSLVSGKDGWTICSPGTPTLKAVPVTCAFPNPGNPLALADIGKLNIVASSSIDPTPAP